MRWALAKVAMTASSAAPPDPGRFEFDPAAGPKSYSPKLQGIFYQNLKMADVFQVTLRSFADLASIRT
jgi:hypothetical protein